MQKNKDISAPMLIAENNAGNTNLPLVLFWVRNNSSFFF
jgi:hypothetical protein